MCVIAGVASGPQCFCKYGTMLQAERLNTFSFGPKGRSSSNSMLRQSINRRHSTINSIIIIRTAFIRISVSSTFPFPVKMTFDFAVKTTTTGFPPILVRRDTFFGGENPEDGTGPGTVAAGSVEVGLWTLVAVADADVATGAVPLVLGLIRSEVLVDFMRSSCCSPIKFGSVMLYCIVLYCCKEGDVLRYSVVLIGALPLSSCQDVYCNAYDIEYRHNLLMCWWGSGV